jgi:carbonic anhydrase/SulP family sulfate permease
MGHTQCGAVTAAVEQAGQPESNGQPGGCQHLEHIVREIQKSIGSIKAESIERSAAEKDSIINAVARRNVMYSVESMIHQSQTLDHLVREGRIAIVGAMYDVGTRSIDFLGQGTSSPRESSHRDRSGDLIEN